MLPYYRKVTLLPFEVKVLEIGATEIGKRPPNKEN